MPNKGGENQNFYLSQSGPNQMNSNLIKMKQMQGEVDYSYNINLNNQSQVQQPANPLLASVNT